MVVNKIRIGIFLSMFFIILLIIVLIILLSRKNKNLVIPFDNLSTCTASDISIPGWKLLPDSSGNCIAKKPQPKEGCCDNDYTYNNTDVCKINFGESGFRGNIDSINDWKSNCISAPAINDLPDCKVAGIPIGDLKHIPYEDKTAYMCFAPKPQYCTVDNGCCMDEYTYENIDGYKYDFTGSHTTGDIYKFMEKCNFTCKKKCDGINCADGCGGTCCNYVQILNNTSETKVNGCFNSNEQSAQELCNNIDDCKGYYVYDRGNFFAVSDKNPLECSSSGNPADDYTIFKTKGPEKDYVSSPNQTGACMKSFYMQKGSNGEDEIKKLCDKLPSCKGYYKNSDESVYVIADKDPGGEYDSGCEGLEDDNTELTFPFFYKKQITNM